MALLYKECGFFFHTEAKKMDVRDAIHDSKTLYSSCGFLKLFTREADFADVVSSAVFDAEMLECDPPPDSQEQRWEYSSIGECDFHSCVPGSVRDPAGARTCVRAGEECGAAPFGAMVRSPSGRCDALRCDDGYSVTKEGCARIGSVCGSTETAELRVSPTGCDEVVCPSNKVAHAGECHPLGTLCTPTDPDAVNPNASYAIGEEGCVFSRCKPDSVPSEAHGGKCMPFGTRCSDTAPGDANAHLALSVGGCDTKQCDDDFSLDATTQECLRIGTDCDPAAIDATTTLKFRRSRTGCDDPVCLEGYGPHDSECLPKGEECTPVGGGAGPLARHVVTGMGCVQDVETPCRGEEGGVLLGDECVLVGTECGPGPDATRMYVVREHGCEEAGCVEGFGEKDGECVPVGTTCVPSLRDADPFASYVVSETGCDAKRCLGSRVQDEGGTCRLLGEECDGGEAARARGETHAYVDGGGRVSCEVVACAPSAPGDEAPTLSVVRDGECVRAGEECDAGGGVQGYVTMEGGCEPPRAGNPCIPAAAERRGRGVSYVLTDGSDSRSCVLDACERGYRVDSTLEERSCVALSNLEDCSLEGAERQGAEVESRGEWQETLKYCRPKSCEPGFGMAEVTVAGATRHACKEVGGVCSEEDAPTKDLDATLYRWTARGALPMLCSVAECGAGLEVNAERGRCQLSECADGFRAQGKACVPLVEGDACVPSETKEGARFEWKGGKCLPTTCNAGWVLDLDECHEIGTPCDAQRMDAGWRSGVRDAGEGIVWTEYGCRPVQESACKKDGETPFCFVETSGCVLAGSECTASHRDQTQNTLLYAGGPELVSSALVWTLSNDCNCVVSDCREGYTFDSEKGICVET